MRIPTVKKLAALAGFTVKTGSNIENAKQAAYRPQTMNQLDRALLWEPGTAQALLDGDSPEIEPYDPVYGWSRPIAETATAGVAGESGGASPSSVDGDVVTLPASALEGLSVEERDEVRAAALAEGLKRAREIQAARRLEEASLPDFSQLAARTVRRRPAWEASRAGADAGEENQDREE
jgi:hypothetical protein